MWGGKSDCVRKKVRLYGKKVRLCGKKVRLFGKTSDCAGKKVRERERELRGRNGRDEDC